MQFCAFYRANPPQFGLCNFMQFYAFWVRSAARCRDKFQNDRHQCPSRVVHSGGEFLPPP